MTFVVEHDGKVSEFPDDSLLIFIDETGHEALSDSNVPFFGFGGCLCKASDYSKLIDEPWSEVEATFAPEQLPLHAADLRPKEMTSEQLAAISLFFEKRNFGRFAAIIKSSAEIETAQSTFHNLAKITLDRVMDVIKVTGDGFSQVLLFFEHSQRTDADYADYFRRYNFTRRDGTIIPAFYSTQPKSAGADFLRGLAVADFVAHTAGVMSRSTRGGKIKVTRRDFDSVFTHALASHMFVDALRENS